MGKVVIPLKQARTESSVERASRPRSRMAVIGERRDKKEKLSYSER